MLLEECFFCIRTTWNGSCSPEHKTIPYGSKTQSTEQTNASTQGHSSLIHTEHRTPRKRYFSIPSFFKSWITSHLYKSCVPHFLHKRFLTHPNSFHRRMNSPMNTDQEIEMQCMEAEQMIIEHDISKEQRKKKKRIRKNDSLRKSNTEHRTNEQPVLKGTVP